MEVLGEKEVLKVKGICPESGLLGNSEGSRTREGLETIVQGSRLFEFPGLRISSVWKADVLKCT